MKKAAFFAIAAAIVIAALTAIHFARNDSAPSAVDESGETAAKKIAAVAASPAAHPSEEAETASSGAPEEESEDAEDNGESAEDKLVDDFDAMTDSWMEPRENGVPIAQSSAFAAAFKALPPGRREECLQRALNLIPDENIMLLLGVLMDKSAGKEYRELVFNDILNRAEEVKMPILREILKDKTHPCWADAAWILDVTGEAPQ